MDSIRFYSADGKFLEEFAYHHLIVPHLGGDIIVNDKRYFVLDVLITYEGEQQYVDVIAEEVNELD